MTVYREGARTEDPTYVIAARRSSASAYALLALPVLFGGILAACFALRVPPDIRLLLAGVFGTLCALAMALMARLIANFKATRFVATEARFDVQTVTRFGGRAPPLSLPWASFHRASAAYLGMSGTDIAIHVAASLTTSSPADSPPTPAVRLATSGGTATIVTMAFRARPEVVARRLERFKAAGPAGLRATPAQIDAHRARFHAPRDLTHGWFGFAACFLRLERDGIRVGRSEARARLVPWEDVSSAYALPYVYGLPDVLQIELVNGDVIDVRQRPGMLREELAPLLAPRWVDQQGQEHGKID